MIYRLLLIGICILCLPLTSRAQEEKEMATVDSSQIVTAVDSTVAAVMQKADSLPFPEEVKPLFKPNPKKSVLMAIVPGLGQELMGVNEINAVTGVLGELGVPLVLNADIGHIDPAMPLIIGSNAEVTVKGNDIKIDMGLSR